MSITVLISNTPYKILEQSIDVDFTSDGRSVSTFTVIDTTGTVHFQPGQPVSITDSVQGYTFTGYINDSQETPQPPTACILHQINVIDGHYIPDKRYYAGPEYQYRYAGDIATDLLRTIQNEGITASYAVDADQSQQDWQAGTLVGCTAANTIPGGDLELSPAGSVVNFAESGSIFATGNVGNTQVTSTPAYPLGPVTPVQALSQKPFYALKITGTQNINNAGNTYTYVKYASGGWVVQSSHYFCYTMFVSATSPEIKIALDIVFTDGTTMRDNATSVDSRNVPPHPKQDLAGLADNQWYFRAFYMGGFAGKTVAYYSVAIEGDKTGTYTGYFRDIYWATDFYGQNVIQYVYQSTSSSLPGPVQQMQDNGFSSTTVSVASCYNPYDFRWTPSYSLSCNIAASTFVTWTAIETNTAASGQPRNGSIVEIGYSLDGGASYIFCTNGAALPDFPIGYATNGLSIQFIQFLASNPSNPEDAPYLTGFEFTANPGYAGTKNDLIFSTATPAQWQSGTFVNTSNNGGFTLSLNGATRNWNDGNTSGQTAFGAGIAGQFVQTTEFQLNCFANSEARSRLDFAGQYADFIAEFQIFINSTATYSCVYRTTGWVSGDSTYAYAVEITTTQVALRKGTNGGASSSSQIAAATLSLASNAWYTVRVVANGQSHSVYINGVQYINATDGTYTGAGYFGLRNRNTTGAQVGILFDSFGICASLTGTWTSPAINLNALTSYYNSDIYYADVSPDKSSNTTSLAVSINGGAWQAVQNGQALATLINGASTPLFTQGQSLLGVSIQLQFTLTTTTPASLPAVNSLSLKILGQFVGSAYRISEALSLAPVGKVGNTSVSWSGIQPANTAIAIDTSLDGVNWTQNVAPGTLETVGATTYYGSGAIAGIQTQTDPVVDQFQADTSLNYTSTYAYVVGG